MTYTERAAELVAVKDLWRRAEPVDSAFPWSAVGNDNATPFGSRDVHWTVMRRAARWLARRVIAHARGLEVRW